MRLLATIAMISCVAYVLRAEEPVPQPNPAPDVSVRKARVLTPSNTKFNSAVTKSPQVLAQAGQALTADGTGKSVWANVLGTNIGSGPASSGMVLQANGNGGSLWGTLGNAQLSNASLTITAGTGLTGGGLVSPGGSTTLSLGSSLTLGGTTTGTFSGPLTGNVTGNVSGTSGSSAAFTGSLAGDVTGTQSATLVSTVGGVTAANVASGANLANAATTAATPNTLVKRDGSGNIPGVLGTFADFYALMPGDNAGTVAPGTAVQFPQNGPLNNISRSSATQFVLPNIGTYQVNFQVSVTEPGQLVVGLNGTELAYTVVGRATGTSQIAGTCLVNTTVVNSVLTIENPTGNSTALTITPLAGGTHSVSAHLVILQIK